DRHPRPVAGLLPGADPGVGGLLPPHGGQPGRRREHAPARAQALRGLPGPVLRLRSRRPSRRAAGVARADRVGAHGGSHPRRPAQVELRPRGVPMRARGALLCLLALAAPALLRGAEPEVMVVLWFDTEDYLLPASDDAAKRVAEILSARGIPGTFKVVG